MKFAVEVARTMLLVTNYVIEAEDMDEARSEVERLFDDPEFVDQFEENARLVDDEGELMIADSFELKHNDYLKPETFFNE